MQGWVGVVLAAGQATRMKSSISKVLHKVCGREMLLYPVQALRDAGVERVVVVVSPGNREAVEGLLEDSVEFANQSQTLGTGHALLQAAPILTGQASHVAVINGDSPLINSASVKALMETHLAREATMTLLTAEDCPQKGFGRVVRGGLGTVESIIEAVEVNDDAPAREVVGGAYCFQSPWVWEGLEKLPVGKNGEFYLTALAQLAHGQERTVEALVCDDASEVMGINDRVQLAQVEGEMYQRIRRHWMLEGVTMVDPPSTFVDATVELGQDTVLQPNTMVLSRSTIGRDCRIGPGSVIRDSLIGDRCSVVASHLEEAILEDDVDVGPFSHLRSGAHLEKGVHVGNFSEIKNSRIGQGSAMGHFGYVGDASIGAQVNLGAGMVTCNYDGVSHQRTEIEDGAFIGCDTMLVAPVRVGAGSITGAGSVVNKDVAPSRLAVGVPAKIKKSKRLSEKRGN